MIRNGCLTKARAIPADLCTETIVFLGKTFAEDFDRPPRPCIKAFYLRYFPFNSFAPFSGLLPLGFIIREPSGLIGSTN